MNDQQYSLKARAINARSKPFQMHLSTALVLTFVAAWVVWANTQPRSINVTLNWERIADHPVAFDRAYGWPTNLAYAKAAPLEGTVLLELGILFNIVISIPIFLAVWVACEYLIRRREEQKRMAEHSAGVKSEPSEN